MFIAVLSGHLESVTVLLERGAVVDARDTDGNTPLFAAAFVHNPDIVDMLVSCGYILAWWINCIGSLTFYVSSCGNFQPYSRLPMEPT